MHGERDVLKMQQRGAIILLYCWLRR